MAEDNAKIKKTYRLDLTDDKKYFLNNNHDNSGVLFVEDLDDIYRLIESEWGKAFHNFTSSGVQLVSDSRTYSYISKYNSFASVCVGPNSPFRVRGLRLVGLTEESLEKTLMSFGLEFDKKIIREGTPY